MLHRNTLTFALGLAAAPLLLAAPLAHATPEPRPAPAAERVAAALPDAPAGTVAAEAEAPAPQRSLGEIFTWRDEASGSWVKPVLQLATGVVNHFPHSDANADLTDRTSTLALARFGLEGKAFDLVRFKTVWERNLGYNITRNGPLGTSIWEGTGSFSTRETFVEVAQWDLTITAGIFTEPGSVDFMSMNTLDFFGMDPFVRDPLIQSGFNLGQGVMLRYQLADFSFGFAYTGGNPLVSSVSGAFGGDVTASGSLYDAPLRDMSAGLPGSNIKMDMFSPSITWGHDFGPVSLGARVAAQWFFVDADVTQYADQPLDGFNYRFSLEASFLDDHVRAFGGYARRGNRQLAVPDLTTYKDDFQARTWHAGLDLVYGPFSLGGSVYSVRRLLGDNTQVDTTTVNIGATWWLLKDSLAAGVRYGSIGWETLNIDRAYVDAETVMASLRLVL